MGFFFIYFDPRGGGDCFCSATAHQLSLERERASQEPRLPASREPSN